ncbi:MAG TPA: hypothetical protein DCM40_08635, partial [Maribacter sp.]|nr:hypothetical protein [Maribacter sp.]
TTYDFHYEGDIIGSFKFTTIENLGSYFTLERAAEGAAGYASATASMQYLRHAWPYYQPIWRLDKLTGRSPFHDSYQDFTNDVDIVGRGYSQIAEFTISDYFEHYNDFLIESINNDRPVYSITEFNRIKRNLNVPIDYAANFAKIIGSSNVGD